MSISKNIVIKEWMTDKNITAETLTTDEVGGGSLIWVPWEARSHVGELSVSHNGEYLAADDGLFGWTKVNVMVAGGNDAELEITEPDGTVHTEWVQAPASTTADNIGYGSGKVVGEMDGVMYEVTLDDEGYLVWTPIESGEEASLVWVEQDVLDAISDAINSKTGGTGDYQPSQMPSAIRGINVCTMSQADDGKVVQGGRLVSQSTIRITQNGTYDTTTKSEALVTVAGGVEFDSQDVGKVVAVGASGYKLAQQTTRNVNANGTYDTTTNDSTVVAVPNSYSQNDVGKKVVEEGGEYYLVPQYPAEEDGKVWIDADVMDEINDAIKTKTGEQNDYDPEEMPDAILGIVSGNANLGTKSITTNGTYAASSDSLDGYSSVSVNVASGGAKPAFLTNSNQSDVLDSLLYTDYDETNGTWGNAIVGAPSGVTLLWDGLYVSGGQITYDVSSLTTFTTYAVLRETQVSSLAGPTTTSSLLEVVSSGSNYCPQFYTDSTSWYTRQIAGHEGDSIPVLPSQLLVVAIAIDATRDTVDYYWSEVRTSGKPIHKSSDTYTGVPSTIRLCYAAFPAYGFLGVVSGVESEATIRANVQELMDYFILGES